MKEILGLSPAETRVARALFEGMGPGQAAAALGLSIFTVRGDLARMFEKTQTAGQVEFVRLLNRLAGPATKVGGQGG
ncbi:MAG: helix-turn-helix transcriptional regulator [Caulobacteraceae bacterium]